MFYITIKVFSKNLAKFTGKYLCQSLFLNKVAVSKPITSLKRTPAKMFSWEFDEGIRIKVFLKTVIWGHLYFSSFFASVHQNFQRKIKKLADINVMLLNHLFTSKNSFKLLFALRQIAYFHLISSCEKFVERRSFRRFSRKPCLPTKFPHQKIRWNYAILCSVGILINE